MHLLASDLVTRDLPPKYLPIPLTLSIETTETQLDYLSRQSVGNVTDLVSASSVVTRQDMRTVTILYGGRCHFNGSRANGWLGYPKGGLAWR